jgi:hypothetical protein
MKLISNLCEQNAKLRTVKACGSYRYHLALNGLLAREGQTHHIAFLISRPNEQSLWMNSELLTAPKRIIRNIENEQLMPSKILITE